MENEYSYYNPNEEDENNIFEEPKKPTGEYHGEGSNMNSHKEPKKDHKKDSKVVRFVLIALLIGIVAGAGFAAANHLVGALLGGHQSQSVIESTQPEKTDGGEVVLNQSSTVITSDVSDIVDSSMPSVVAITNMSVQEVRSFFGGIQEQESKSCGSGIIIGQNDTELLIVTNNHVVEGAKTLTVSFVDDAAVEGVVKGTDASKDLAVVAVPLENISADTKDAIKVITLGDSTNLKVGEPVIAIGNALGYGQSVTTGIVSALNRNLEMEGFDSLLIQTDAAINPGNSGGALLNANGELIGINTVKVNANAVEGMGYAIPISDANEVIKTLMTRTTRTIVSEAERGFLGIRGVDVTSDSAKMYNMPTGVYISEVIDGGGAKKAGLSKGSIITKFDGITIDSMSTLQQQLQYYRVGEEVEVTIQVPDSNGDYTENTVTVTLGKNME